MCPAKEMNFLSVYIFSVVGFLSRCFLTVFASSLGYVVVLSEDRVLISILNTKNIPIVGLHK